MQTRTKLPEAFSELGIEIPLLKALQKLSFTQPTDIQKALIPLILQGKDVLGQARTGTGKTAAFGLPVLQLLDPQQSLQALCLVPTRELAVQVAAELTRLGEFTSLRCVPVYGGEKISHQVHQLRRKHHFVVGTPGRVMDMMQRKILHFDNVRFAILDEVDRMLDIGFRDDIRKILGTLRTKHQTIVVSATIDDEIKRLASSYTQDAVEVNVSRDSISVEEVDQVYCSVHPRDKFRLLQLVLDVEEPPLTIIFTNTKHAARKLSKKLFDAGISAREIHGDLEQRKRDRVMDSFRKHRLKILVATDLAARGIDVSAITHIVNFDIPVDPQIYVHRIGRTARMGAKGKAITFVTPEQGKQLTDVEKLINRQIPQVSYDGFESTESEWKSDTSAPEPHAPSSAPVATITAPAKPKTLGGKFPTRRRRRR